MKWWPRRKPAAAPTALEPCSLNDWELEVKMTAASNVMAVRDGVNVLLTLLWEHRQDGHECLPYCVPRRFNHYLGALDANDLRMMLTVTLHDMVDSYMRQEAE